MAAEGAGECGQGEGGGGEEAPQEGCAALREGDSRRERGEEGGRGRERDGWIVCDWVKIVYGIYQQVVRRISYACLFGIARRAWHSTA